MGSRLEYFLRVTQLLTLPWNLTTNTHSFEMLNKIGFFIQDLYVLFCFSVFSCAYFLNGLDK